MRSVASIFISRWDKAIADKVPANLRNKLGIAIGQQAYKAYRDLMDSDRWQRLENQGARPQRLLFASTGTKDPEASDVLYITALAAPNTVNTMPEKTLLAFGDHGKVDGALPRDGGNAEEVLAEFAKAGVDVVKLAADLQEEGAKSFDSVVAGPPERHQGEDQGLKISLGVFQRPVTALHRRTGFFWFPGSCWGPILMPSAAQKQSNPEGQAGFRQAELGAKAACPSWSKNSASRTEIGRLADEIGLGEIHFCRGADNVFSGCAGGPFSPPVNQAGCHIVQGGPFAGEGMINFSLGLPNDKK